MGSIFGYKTEVVMRIAIAELLVFAYNLEYLLRLTKLKYTHIFIVDLVEEFTVPITIKAPSDICYKIVHNSIWTHTK